MSNQPTEQSWQQSSLLALLGYREPSALEQLQAIIDDDAEGQRQRLAAEDLNRGAA